TPFADGAVVCSDDASRCWWTLAPEVGEASSARLPAYRALDLGAEWSRDWSSGRSLTAFVQVKNVLGWRNRAAYLGSGARPMGPCTAGDDTDCGVTRHQTLPGLRVTPAAGLRVAF